MSQIKEEVMQDRKKLSRLAIAGLLAVAVGVPTATAAGMPIDSTRYVSQQDVLATTDMHASTVQAPAAPKQDLRSENAIAPSRAAAVHPRGVMPDLRGEFAADPEPAPGTPAGLPTWPVDPKPIAPVVAQPVDGDGNGIDIEWPIAALLLSGALVLGSALTFAAKRVRTQAAH